MPDDAQWDPKICVRRILKLFSSFGEAFWDHSLHCWDMFRRSNLGRLPESRLSSIWGGFGEAPGLSFGNVFLDFWIY